MLLLVSVVGTTWGRAGRFAHRVYGVAMIAAAVYSHRPWTDVPFDAVEDVLHSVAATGMGFAFTAGVVLVAWRRGVGLCGTKALDVVAVVAAVVLPLGMVTLAASAGLLQRIMFAIGYAWYGAEALRWLRRPGGSVPA